MTKILACLVIFHLGASLAYNAYQRQSHTYGEYNTGTAGSASSTCCTLDSWAYSHMDEVIQFANRLRQLYNAFSQGNSVQTLQKDMLPWQNNIIQLTHKSALDLDLLSRNWAEKLILDMKNGALDYSTIAKPNFFEYKAAEILRAQNDLHILDVGGNFHPLDLTDFDEVKNYAYPAEVKVINGKTYVVHKNCTEATKTMGEGTLSSPLITVLKRNRTIITSGNDGNYPSSMNTFYGPTTSTNSITRKTNIYDWVNSNLEPSVVDYKPTVSINSAWAQNSMQTYPFIPRQDSTVTVHRYNETIVRNSDRDDYVKGSESKRKWVNGKLVFEEVRPFSSGSFQSLHRDEAWKREERERLFWLLKDSTVTSQSLEMWQRQQEDRLLGLAQRYQISMETIHNWHQQELERFKQLLRQYSYKNQNTNDWKSKECGRLDWLIHQNSLTQADLLRWQNENQDKLQSLARMYNISLTELKNWQIEELTRIYVIFDQQNQSMIPSASQYSNAEQARLEALIREHNATISQLQNSIHMDQQKLMDFRRNYQGNVTDTEKWLKSEISRLSSLLNEQRLELTKITEWQNSERQRLASLLQSHQGSIANVEAQMAKERNYIQTLAAKYHVSIDELEKWQRAELERLQRESKTQIDMNVKAWQAREHENLMSIIRRNDLTIEEFQSKILNDRAKLEDLAGTYKVQVSEVEEWFKQELKNFQNQGLLKEVEKHLSVWQEKERQRLLKIVSENALSMEELEQKIKEDQTQLYALANKYHIRVEELEEWLKQEFQRLQKEGLVKVEDLKDWQKSERHHIMQLVQQNKLTIEEFEQKLLKDRQRLQSLANVYNIERTELEAWIREEINRLQKLGLLQIKEQLSQWQQIERERLLALVNQNKLTLEELEERIRKDQTHLYSLAHQHQVRVEEIEDWIKQEIKKLQEDGLLEMAKLKDWQSEWRGNLTNMVQERDFTVEEFHKWLLDDRARLQALAVAHNVQIEEIEQWVRNEEQRFVSMGLLKPNEKLTNWQQVERQYLERIAQEQQYRSTEQLELRLRQDRELLEQLARQYSVQVEEIQQWMKKELQRLRDEGQLQIDNLTAWQLSERDRLEQLIAAKKSWNLSELETTLRKDREHMQKLAFQYHTSIEEIERWLKSEIKRLEDQGKIEIRNLTEWQQAEQNRILSLLANQSSITEAEFENKVQQDYIFLQNLANQHHVSVMDIESYVKNVIEELKQKGKFEMENLQTWQLVERDYIKQLISQYDSRLTTAELENKLRSDRAHLQQLAAQYRINVEQIEKWMLEELRRLRSSSEHSMQQLSKWQEDEVTRLKQLLRENQQLDFVAYEVQLMKERQRLEQLAKEYAISVTEIENWLRQQLLNLKTSGQVQMESLAQWQEEEQKRIIEMLLQHQDGFSFNDLDVQLRQNRSRLEEISQNYSVSITQIEHWMHDELRRLQNSGLVQVEHLSQWQQAERENLRQWLQQLNHNVSYNELMEFLHRDQRRLEEIAREYQITVEEVEAWVQLEAARLQFLNAIKQPESSSLIDEQILWKQHTQAHLRGIAMAKPNMSWQDFEEYLQREHYRWQQLAFQYNISVEEIEQWLRQTALELQREGLIANTSTTTEIWQINEQRYIQNLINEALRKDRQQWTFEELEQWLIGDLNRTQQLAREHDISVETIISWYREELRRLLAQKKILLENLLTWQLLERKRIYATVLSQPVQMRTNTHLEALLIQNDTDQSRLASKYHVTVEELREWIYKELQRLRNLGVLYDNVGVNWQQRERKRLRNIANELRITYQEMLEFIAADSDFQQLLCTRYSCTLNQLAPFQSIELNKMQKEQLFENRQLNILLPWQIKERDRLYGFIKNQNLTLKNLRDFQREEVVINDLAKHYGISANALKNWQIQEFERLIKLAESYRMSLYQLQEFREKELQRIEFIMHKEIKSAEQFAEWNASELKRLQALQRTTELSLNALESWRRRLYLLCQGLISSTSGHAGHDVGPHTTNRTAGPDYNISKDRGDQPPHIYDENMEGGEPGLEGEDPVVPPALSPIIDVTATTQVPYTIRPTSNIGIGGGTVQSGFRYSKQEYKYTAAPISMGATASASADSYGSSASASIMSPLPYNHAHGRRHSGSEGQVQVQENDSEIIDQQIQQEESANLFQQQQKESVESLGQQQQVEEKLDLTQQQQIFEDYQQQRQEEMGELKESDSQAKLYSESQKNPYQSTVVKTEPDSNTGFWSNLKKKTTDLFG